MPLSVRWLSLDAYPEYDRITAAIRMIHARHESVILLLESALLSHPNRHPTRLMSSAATVSNKAWLCVIVYVQNAITSKQPPMAFSASRSMGASVLSMFLTSPNQRTAMNMTGIIHMKAMIVADLLFKAMTK